MDIVEVVIRMNGAVEAVRSPSESSESKVLHLHQDTRNQHLAVCRDRMQIQQVIARAPGHARQCSEPGLAASVQRTPERCHAMIRDGGRWTMVTVPPSTRTGQPSSDQRSSPSRGRHGLSIVIVEDNDDSRDMLQMLLESRGHEVLAARDGKEGAQVIVERQPDLALVDIGLPTMNGYDVARTVRAACPEAQIYMVALTGYGRQEDRDAVMAAGFDEHIVKPIEPSDLNRLAGKVSGQ